MRKLALALGVLVVLLAGSAESALAQGPPTPQQVLSKTLTRAMHQIGGASSAYVVDLQTGQVLFSDAAGIGRPPASVEKLYTTSTALLRFGPNATLSTAIEGVGSLDPTGTWNGTLYLVGGGDPSFGSSSFDHVWYGAGATMQRLVSNLVTSAGIHAIRGGVVG